ncbi:hypothetical protein OG401_23965 [Kitasatospora purpeofusca]|uniref:hypothetical protein n=1 Tax=Kitasatospora purpeofusca TaxID=67352 RepID=UPI00224D9E8F|nr:hypothetical protein [Kitasatospora purpeofusca]MCX4687321.1 hypothetical protein [Kitasatospora purpeofusca]
MSKYPAVLGVVQHRGRVFRGESRSLNGPVVVVAGRYLNGGSVSETHLAFEPEDAYRLGHRLIEEAREILVERGRKERGESG